MIIKSIGRQIRRAFSNSALQYDALTGLHKEIGRELIEKIYRDMVSAGPALKILDVGMGTGYLTKRLKNFFPGALVLGLDFADGMIACANQPEDFQIIQADACDLPFKEGCFDLIASNLAYQWVEDLPRAFRRSYRVLKREGRFSLTVFGYETFKELFYALEQSVDPKSQIEETFFIRRLAARDQIEAALAQAGFVDIVVDVERIKVRFPDMIGLIQWTKNIGANRRERNIYIGKEFLGRANEYYEKYFKDDFGIYATFEVVWASGKKK